MVRIRITVKEMIDKIREDEDFGPSYVPDNLDNLQSTFLGLADGDWIIDTNLYTIEQMEAMDRAEERRECEQAVAEVCQQYDLTPGTTAFFTKLEELIEATYQDREDFNSYDRRAEMFMDHRFAGGGSETYYDDLNYTNSEYSQKMEKLSTALEWAQKCCPLLWMQYEESKLSNTKLKEAA